MKHQIAKLLQQFNSEKYCNDERVVYDLVCP
jgi:hypothetical protein